MSPLAFVLAFVLIVSSSSAVCTDCGCNDVYDNFRPCARFIEGLCNNPSPACCQRLSSLNAIAKQENGGQMRICQCIENFAKYEAQRPFDASRIQALPVRCNTILSFPISEHMDCSMIN